MKIFPAPKVVLQTKIMHMKFGFLTHSLVEIISLTVFPKDPSLKVADYQLWSCDHDQQIQ